MPLKFENRVNLANLNLFYQLKSCAFKGMSKNLPNFLIQEQGDSGYSSTELCLNSEFFKGFVPRARDNRAPVDVSKIRSHISF